MTVKFTKMQGLGNDYLYVYGPVPDQVEELCIRLSDRHFGAGSDGMIFISPSASADFSMRIFNADGSEAMMCGNGIRCVGKYVFDKGYTDKTDLRIETRSGIRHLTLFVEDGAVKEAEVDMGTGVLSEPRNLSVSDHDFTCYPVSVGNPHAVIFTASEDEKELETYGPLIECHEAFLPDRTNVEFVRVLEDGALRMRVWERGSGITMACGTGACASVFAAVKLGFCSYDTPIRVDLDGGSLLIRVQKDDRILMRGPAAFVFEGEACDDLLSSIR